MGLRRDIAFGSAAALASAFGRFTSSLIFARNLDLTSFGHFSFAVWIVDFSLLLFSFGVGPILSRYLAQFAAAPPMQAALWARMRSLVLVVPALSTTGACLGFALFEGEQSASLLLSLACWSFVGGILTLNTAVLAGLQRWDLLLLQNGVSAAIMVGGALLAAHLDWGLLAAFATMAVASVGALVAGRVPASHHKVQGASAGTSIDWKSVRLFAFNSWATAVLASLAWSRGELPVLRWQSGAEAVANYSAALLIWGGVTQVLMLGMGPVSQMVTRNWGAGNMDSTRRLAAQSFDVQILIAAVSGVGLITFGDYLLAAMFANKYSDAAPALSLLCLGLVAFAVSMQSHLLQLQTDGRFNRNVLVLAVVGLFATAVPLIIEFDTRGAAASRFIALAIVLVATVTHARRVFGPQIFSQRNLVVACIALGSAAVLQSFTPTSYPIARITIFLILFAGLILGFRDESGAMVAGNIWRFVRQFRRDKDASTII